MNNPVYNSLADKLKQSGILAPEETKEEDNLFLKNMFATNSNPQAESSDENQTDTRDDEKSAKKPAFKKRLNSYDLELIEGRKDFQQNPHSPFIILKRFLNLKEAKLNKGSATYRERILNRLFPRLYKIKIARDAIKRLYELDIDTQALLDKTIPYGESEIRYENLVKYLKYANEIQNKLNKRFD